MATFLFCYRTPKGYIAGRDEAMEAWSAWFDAMGDSVRDRGNPLGGSATVGDLDAAGSKLGGYSLIAADSLDEAVALAKGCPVLAEGGGVEVGALVTMKAPVTE
jgi:hypothetical protein